jgi:hypothetical protein
MGGKLKAIYRKGAENAKIFCALCTAAVKTISKECESLK